jgi:hypothetical protein
MKTRIEDAAKLYAKDTFFRSEEGEIISEYVMDAKIESFIAGAEFMQKEFNLAKHQLDYAEKVLTEVQAEKFELKVENIELKKKAQMNIHYSAFNGLLTENSKLKAQNQIMREALKRIPEQEINNHERKDMIAKEALKKIKGV